eukprot:m.22024 g.22024  ORF g.22024 m.22024 type:complete len:327 (+) comp9141_c0_seq3:95-1075(+)
MPSPAGSLLLLAAVLALAVTSAAATADQNKSHAATLCSRPVSRNTAAATDRTIFSLLRSEGIKLDTDVFEENCPFLPSNNYFHVQERHIVPHGSSRVICGLCGKTFVSTPFLDKHMQARHPSNLSIHANATCLAELCDIFLCDLEDPMEDYVTHFLDLPCLPHAMEALEQRCVALMYGCVRPEKTQLRDRLITSVCSRLSCPFLLRLRESTARRAFRSVRSVLAESAVVVAADASNMDDGDYGDEEPSGLGGNGSSSSSNSKLSFLMSSGFLGGFSTVLFLLIFGYLYRRYIGLRWLNRDVSYGLRGKQPIYKQLLRPRKAALKDD